MIQSKACVVTLVLKYLKSKESQIEKPEPGSFILCRKNPLAPSAKLFITKCPWGQYTTAG